MRQTAKEEVDGFDLSPDQEKPNATPVSLFPPGGLFLMSIHAIVPPIRNHGSHEPTQLEVSLPQPRTSQVRARRAPLAPLAFRFPAQSIIEEGTYRQAELFYLQKQIQSQTPMVVVLEDGEHVEGCIEWYDRNSLKVRGRAKTLVYKSAIKYMYKLGEQGQ
jgi:sRNA-binding regulator protein Hfq